MKKSHLVILLLLFAYFAQGQNIHRYKCFNDSVFILGDEFLIPGNYFSYPSKGVFPNYRDSLQFIAEFLKVNRNDLITIRVNSYACSDAESNMELSYSEAKTLERYFIEVCNVKPSQVRSIACGEEYPVSNEDSEMKYPKNSSTIICLSSAFSTHGDHLDPFRYWQYKFTESKVERSLGTLFLQRKIHVFSENQKDSIRPQIRFEIFPIEHLDSIDNHSRDMAFCASTLFPIGGSCMVETEKFVFYSDYYSSTSAFDCLSMDYTRGNASRILKHIADKKYESLEDLIDDLPISNNPEIEWERRR